MLQDRTAHLDIQQYAQHAANSKALHAAVESQNCFEMVRFLLHNGFNPNVRMSDSSSTSSSGGGGPSSSSFGGVANRNGRKNFSTSARGGGAGGASSSSRHDNSTRTSHQDNTPLISFVKKLRQGTAAAWVKPRDRKGVIDLLIQNKADVNARDGANRSALWWAARFGNAEAVADLLGRGARREIADRLNNRAVDVTVSAVVREMLEMQENLEELSGHQVAENDGEDLSDGMENSVKEELQKRKPKIAPLEQVFADADVRTFLRDFPGLPEGGPKEEDPVKRYRVNGFEISVVDWQEGAPIGIVKAVGKICTVQRMNNKITVRGPAGEVLVTEASSSSSVPGGGSAARTGGISSTSAKRKEATSSSVASSGDGGRIVVDAAAGGQNFLGGGLMYNNGQEEGWRQDQEEGVHNYRQERTSTATSPLSEESPRQRQQFPGGPSRLPPSGSSPPGSQEETPPLPPGTFSDEDDEDEEQHLHRIRGGPGGPVVDIREFGGDHDEKMLREVHQRNGVGSQAEAYERAQNFKMQGSVLTYLAGAAGAAAREEDIEEDIQEVVRNYVQVRFACSWQKFLATFVVDALRLRGGIWLKIRIDYPPPIEIIMQEEIFQQQLHHRKRHRPKHDNGTQT